MHPVPPRSWSLALALTACAAPREPPAVAPAAAPVVVPVVVPVPVVPVVRPDEAVAICAEADAATRIRVRVEHAILACEEGRLDRCQAEARHVIANCGAEPVLLRRLVFGDPALGGRAMIVEPAEPRIEPRRSWAWTRKVFHESADILHVEVVELDGAAIVVAELPVHVSNPAREAAMAACAACGGVWGIQGLRYHDGCNCRARDAGQPCHDGGACEGACKFDRWEVSRPAEPARCKGKVCGGPAPAIGRPVGRCSDRVAIRSCHTLLRKGVAAEPDQALPWGITRICVD